MSGILNVGSLTGTRFPNQVNAPKAPQKWSWSFTDTIKWMVYSVLSCTGSQWAVNNKLRLVGFYSTHIDPETVKKNVKAAELKLAIRARREEFLKHALPFLSEKIVAGFRSPFADDAMLSGSELEKILLSDENFWPAKLLSLDELFNHFFPGWQDSRFVKVSKDFVEKCRGIISGCVDSRPSKPIVLNTKELDEQLLKQRYPFDA